MATASYIVHLPYAAAASCMHYVYKFAACVLPSHALSHAYMATYAAIICHHKFGRHTLA